MEVYKERIVGALVLVALAVIVLPWLLDDDKENSDFHTRIPAQPASPSQQVVELSGSRPLDEVTSTESVIAISAATRKEPTVIEGDSGTKEVTPTPNLPSAFNDRGFIIQLGSFSNIENAQKLVARLQAAGHKAYMRKETRDGVQTARVLEGPHLEKAEADALLPKLRAIAGNNGIVVPFDPLKH